jgi:hypothetical protein
MAKYKLNWHKIKAGWYEATDSEGTLLRVVQSASNQWEVIRPPMVECHGATLAEAKSMAEDISCESIDPEYRARRLARLARRQRKI